MKNIITKKAFTLIEIITVFAIMGIITGTVSLGINSFGTSTEFNNIESLISSKIRSEKIGIISGAIDCSQTNIHMGNAFFTILNSKKYGDMCKKDFFGNIYVESGNVIIENNAKNNQIEILKIGRSFGNLNTNNKKPNIISFKLTDSQDYKVISENSAGEREEIEIIFFNSKINEIDLFDPKIILVDNIKGEDFRKNTVYSNYLNIVFQTPTPEAKMYSDNNKRINNINISIKNGNEDKNNFNMFSY